MGNLKLFVAGLGLLVSLQATAQQHAAGIPEGVGTSNALFEALYKLDQNIQHFFAPVTARRLSRELTWFKTDMQTYLQLRYKVMILLERHQYDTHYFVASNGHGYDLLHGLKDDVTNLERQLGKLHDRMARIAPYINQNADMPQQLANEVFQIGTDQSVNYLYEINELLGGNQQIDRAALKRNGEDIYNRFVHCMALIDNMQRKLAPHT